ncbi:MAG: Trk system potassium transporter TrkA [Oscillospiraceae bacterium]|nr:Trk system potassium transporter TrkA [Oscillospiraceae bacterium]MDD4413027.1 Trk system potassium transporter TrkA [Oscillospiraceae bacterium]
MKIIIVGCGKIGYTVAKVLSDKKGIHVTVVDNDPNVFDNAAEPIDVIFIEGNGASEKTLIEAGAKDADLIVSTTNADELNVLCCIMAKHLGTNHSIARVRNPEYMLEFNNLWKEIGIDMVINPERQTAREISRILRYPAANDIDTFINGRVELVSFSVSEKPEYFVGKSVSQLFDRNMGILLAVVERENKALIPYGDFVFKESDIVRILGRPSQIMKFFTKIKKAPKKAQEVMIIGGGRITHYLAELLNRHTVKTKIKIIEKDRRKCEALCQALSSIELERRCMFINGDGTNEELLVAEEIDSMDAFVCLTDSDEENAIISLYALKMGVKKVVTKVNHIHQNMIKNLGLGLGSIITPQSITANSVARYVDGLTGITGSNIRMMHRIFFGDDGNVEAIEFHVNKKAKYLDTPIKDLKLKKGVLIGCISRGSEIIIPSGETQISIGDSVIVITKNKDISNLDDILTNRVEVFADTEKTEQEG